MRVIEFTHRLPRLTRHHYIKHKTAARQVITARVNHFNQYYQFSFGRISIRNQKTRWGSCSRKKNLNFNFKLLFVPEALLDYVVVHELCHLAELNHSVQFWQLVAHTQPNFRQLRRELLRLQ